MRTQKKNIDNKKRACALNIVKALAVLLAAVLIGFILIKHRTINCGGQHADKVEYYTPKRPEKGKLNIYCFDVGQGDSFLIVSPNGKTMLVDSGDIYYKNRVAAIMHRLGIKKLDAAMGTHPHTDHIGAMPYIIEEFGASVYYIPDVPFENVAGEYVEKALENRKTKLTRLHSGDEIRLDDEIKIEILSPVQGCEYSSGANEWSIMFRVEFGDNSMLFTADATVHNEQLVMFHTDDEKIRADILKVAHHGGTTSSSLGFLETVGAEYALISVGASNPYGHPDYDTLNKLRYIGSKVYRTDTMGCISVTMDGKRIVIECEKP